MRKIQATMNRIESWTEDFLSTFQVGLTRTLRVSGICVVERAAGRDAQARLSRIEHIGVDSQLCVMLLDRFDSLTFLPGGP